MHQNCTIPTHKTQYPKPPPTKKQRPGRQTISNNRGKIRYYFQITLHTLIVIPINIAIYYAK